MRRSMPFVPLTLVALLAAGCPATTTTTAPPPIDMRAVHLAQAPAAAEFVVQADLPRVLDAATLERWLGWMLQMESATVDPACALALLGRAQILTEVMLGI
ncbi:MAG: hypothetical protein JXB32_01860, partial [Deltaproteobacteria bacterium]|nr:hypothetical protein [Deltaproteobacteria bacterium]